jgi:hypothetical protein
MTLHGLCRKIADMPKLPPPRDTPPPRRRPPFITAYSNYQLRQRRSLIQRTVPNGEVADAFIGMHGLNGRKGARCRKLAGAGRDDHVRDVLDAEQGINGGVMFLR